MKTLPRVLIVHMKRFDYFGSKLNFNLEFPSNFSFPDTYLNAELTRMEREGYKSDPLPPDFPGLNTLNKGAKRQHTYELYAMIVHHGYSSNRGHYYCLIRNQRGGWIKFDDEKITVIEDADKFLSVS